MKIWFAALAILISTKAFSQSGVAIDITDKEVLTFVEEMPEFPGGVNALLTYLRTNIDYPDSARVKNIEGKVFLRFVIDEEGNVTHPEVLRSLHPLLDAEAIRVVQQMPKWSPGKQNGKPVSVYFTLPIFFTLE